MEGLPLFVWGERKKEIALPVIESTDEFNNKVGKLIQKEGKNEAEELIPLKLKTIFGIEFILDSFKRIKKGYEIKVTLREETYIIKFTVSEMIDCKKEVSGENGRSKDYVILSNKKEKEINFYLIVKAACEYLCNHGQEF